MRKLFAVLALAILAPLCHAQFNQNNFSSPVQVNANQNGTWNVGQNGTWTVQPGNTANTTAWLVTGSGGTFPVTGTFWQATQPVSGTFWQTTQPISGTVAATESGTWNVGQTGTWTVTGAGGTFPVTGTFWQTTQPVSGTFWQSTQPISGTVAATQSGSWSNTATQASGANLHVDVDLLPALPAGANTIGAVFGTGAPGLPSPGVVSVQGIPNGTPLAVKQASQTPFNENLQQIGNNAVQTGAGVGGPGVPRVTVSSDSFPATQPVSGTVSVSGGAAPQAPAVIPTMIVMGPAAAPPVPATTNPLLYRAALQTYCYQNLAGCGPTINGGTLK